MMPVQLLERSNGQQVAAAAEAVERDGRIEQAVHIQRVHVLRRLVRSGEAQMALEQRPYVRGVRVVDRDLAVRHSRSIREREPGPTERIGWLRGVGANSTEASGCVLFVGVSSRDCQCAVLRCE